MAIINIALGANVNGALDDVTGHLIITGTGAMDDWDLHRQPLYPHKGIVKTVEIQDGVTTIGQRCFQGCNVLTNITIPNSVTSIGASSFYSCYALTSIVIPNGVTSLPPDCFNRCSGLESIVLPNTLALIGSGCFYECIALKNITFPNTLKTIGNRCFRGCSSLKSIVIPNSVTALEYSVFPFCSSLSSITFEEPCQITELATDPYSPHGMFYECSSLSSLTIPSSITAIGSTSINDCNALTEIINNAKSAQVLGTDSFFLFPTNGPISVHGYSSNTTFKNAVSDKSKFIWNELPSSEFVTIKLGATISSTLSTDGKLVITGTGAMDNWSSSNYPLKPYINAVRTVEIQNGITNIGNYCFQDCIALKSVTFPNTLKTIGGYCFRGCSSLKSITIPNSVTALAYSVFPFCSSLSSITFEEPCQITAFPTDPNAYYGMFYECSSLSSLTIPSSITAIGKDFAKNCNALTEIINNSKSAQVLGTNPFFLSPTNGPISVCGYSSNTTFKNAVSDTTKFTWNEIVASVMLGDNVEGILLANGTLKIRGYGSMYNTWNAETYPLKPHKSAIKTVEIQDGVTSIGNYCFDNCEALTSVAMPNTVTSLGEGCFDLCTALTSITIPSSVTSIGVYCFYSCSALAHVIICDGVTSLPYCCFYECIALASVTIPNTVTSMGAYCFYYCNALPSIIIPSSVTSIGESCFESCTALSEIINAATLSQNLFPTSFNCIPINKPIPVYGYSSNTLFKEKIIAVPANFIWHEIPTPKPLVLTDPIINYITYDAYKILREAGIITPEREANEFFIIKDVLTVLENKKTR